MTASRAPVVEPGWAAAALLGFLHVQRSLCEPASALAAAAAATTGAAPPNALRPPMLHRLPTGATKPQGWLKDELTLQAQGISGQLPLFWPFFNASSWVTNGTGAAPAQYIPYYLNGLVPLSYQLDDSHLASLRTSYVHYILAHQHPSGWLGHEVPRNASAPSAVPGGVNEYWPKYLAVNALESYAEASPPAEAQRVVTALVGTCELSGTRHPHTRPNLRISVFPTTLKNDDHPVV